MVAYRGVYIGAAGSQPSTGVPVLSAQLQGSRGLIVEQSFGSAGEAKIYDGPLVVSGSFEAAYRSSADINGLITDIMSVMSGTTDKLTEKAITISDEYGAMYFPHCLVNSFDLQFNVKDFAKITFGFLSKDYGTQIASPITATTYSAEIPLASASIITANGAGSAFSGISIKGEIPLDQDYYVIGSKQLEDLLQGGNGSLSGSLTLAASEWAGFTKSVSDCGVINEVKLEMKGADPSTCTPVNIKTITIKKVKIESSSVSGQGRSRFDKSINWKAEVNNTDNKTILS